MEGIQITLILASAYLNYPCDHAMNMNQNTGESFLPLQCFPAPQPCS